MTQRSSRNKIRFQITSAFTDLSQAQDHLVQAAALADERSDYINEHLPVIIGGLQSLLAVLEKFEQGI